MNEKGYKIDVPQLKDVSFDDYRYLRVLLTSLSNKRISIHYFDNELIIPSGSLNEIGIKELVLVNSTVLESITIKANSLKNLEMLMISNNPQLRTIDIEDGYGGYSDVSKNTGAFYYTKSVELSSIDVFLSIMIKSSYAFFYSYW